MSILTCRLFLFSACVWLVAGVICGMDPNNIEWQFLHMHLIYVGFTSSILFAIGYWLLPWAAGVSLHWPKMAFVHFLASNLAIIGTTWAWILKHHHTLVSPAVAIFAIVYLCTHFLFAANLAATFWEVFQRDRYRNPLKPQLKNGGALPLFVAAALVYLLVGAFVVLFYRIGDIHGKMVHVHFLEAGFIGNMLFAAGYYVLPPFLAFQLKNPRWVKWHFWLANGTLVCLCILWIFRDMTQAKEAVFFTLAFAYCGANLLFAANVLPGLWKSALPKVPRSLKGSQRGQLIQNMYHARFALVSVVYFLFLFFSTGVGGSNNIGWQFVHAHTLDMGWVSMMIYALAYSVFPVFTGRQIQFPLLVRLHFWAGNLSLIGLSSIWRLHIYDSVFNAGMSTFAIGHAFTMFVFAGIVCVSLLWPSSDKGSVPGEGFITPGSSLGDILIRWPGAVRVLVDSGFTELSDATHREFLKQAKITLESACSRKGIHLPAVLAKLGAVEKG